MSAFIDFPRGVVLLIGLLACVSDVRTRRIPNLLTFGTAFAAFVFHGVSGGPAALWQSITGWMTGVALFLPFFVLRGLGGGDVKLLAAIGAWVGPSFAAWTAMYASLAGGAMGLIVAFARGYLWIAISNLWSMVSFWRVAGLKPYPGLTLDTAGGPRLAYAIPIAVGAMVTIWLR